MFNMQEQMCKTTTITFKVTFSIFLNVYAFTTKKIACKEINN